MSKRERHEQDTWIDALIFGAPRWIAATTGNIHMKTSQEQK